MIDAGLDLAAPTPQLVRMLRTPPEPQGMLPESVLWRVFWELRRRGEPAASQHFVGGLRQLHRRRTLGGTALAVVDPHHDEHKMAGDPYLGELWRSYKRCLCANRTGPAAQILREVEQQLHAV